MSEISLLFLEKICEAIYFSLFLIYGKKLKNKRLLLTVIMIGEYLLLKHFISYNVLFQVCYTFMSFINLKVLYKEKAQVTDIFLFTTASLLLILISVLSYGIIYFTIKEYIVALILSRIIMFLFLVIVKDKINNIYKHFYKLWNRHNKPNKIKSLTLRNISIIIFNLMFWIINMGMVVHCILDG